MSLFRILNPNGPVDHWQKWPHTRVRPFRYEVGDTTYYVGYHSVDGRIFKISKEAFYALDPGIKDVDALEQVLAGQSSLDRKGIESLFNDIQILHKRPTQTRPASVIEEDVHVEALSLMVEQSCNLSCRYCYAGDGEYGHKGKMTFETAKAAIDQYAGNDLHVSFFGGEPLLNFSLIKKTVAYCQQLEQSTPQKFSYSITTNGVLLEGARAQFLCDHNFSVIASIDGAMNTQNTARPFAKGRDGKQMGSFDIVRKNIEAFEKRIPDLTNLLLRATISPLHLDHLQTDVSFLLDNFKASISFCPMFGGRYGPEWDIEKIKQYREVFENVLDAAMVADDIDKMMRLGQVMNLAARIHDGEPSGHHCEAGRRYVSVSADGRVFPCHRFNDIDAFAREDEAFSGFKNTSVYERPAKVDCARCWMKAVCGGGCFATHHFYNSDLVTPFRQSCMLYEVDFLLAVKLYGFLHEMHPGLMKKCMRQPLELLFSL